jgi:adenylate cyclase
MNDEKINRKLTAILSADAKGYSRLMGKDDVATVQTLKKCHEIMSTEIQRHHGRVIDSPGDNLLAEFASVVDAVKCALLIQERLNRYEAEIPEDKRMPFRIGINLGDVIVDSERIYGDGVNIAARLESLADAGGICLSGSAYDQVQSKLAFGGEFIGEQQVKNIATPIKVYKIWPDPEAGGHITRERQTNNSRRLWLAVAAVLIFMGGAAAFYVWRGHQQQGPATDTAQFQQQQEISSSPKPSIAVLPFNNLSDDKEQEYFSDGITNRDFHVSFLS